MVWATLGLMGKSMDLAVFPLGFSPSIHHNRMKDCAAATVSDEAFAQRAERYPVDTPDTKEAYWIREIFESASNQFSKVLVADRNLLLLDHFPSEAAAKTAVRCVRFGA